MIPPEVVLATANAGKVRELAAVLRAWGVATVRSLADVPDVELPEETGTTYLENARLKAAAVAQVAQRPALADDSGLEVDALDGAPGIHSARWAPTDTERIAKLLEALRGVPPARRGARFRAVVVLAWPDGRWAAGEGACEGRITEAPDGGGGFGYDPVFWSNELATTFGRAAAEQKAAVSHRARALAALRQRLG